MWPSLEHKDLGEEIGGSRLHSFLTFYSCVLHPCGDTLSFVLSSFIGFIRIGFMSYSDMSIHNAQKIVCGRPQKQLPAE